MRTHETHFLVERAVENATDTACRALLDGMNAVCGEVDRRFTFGSLSLVDNIPSHFPGSPSELPAGDVPMMVWLRRGDRIGSGNMGIGQAGEGIARFASPRMYLPSEADWFRFRHVPLHEAGHVHGLAVGDHVYRMANVSDATGIAPTFGIAIANPSDEFWATHDDWRLDPMFNAAPNTRWCALHRRILLGEYRVPHRMVPVPLDIVVRVVDASSGEPVEKADVFVLDCDMDTDEWRMVHYQHAAEFAARRWENESYQSTQGATLIKAYAPGYLPRCFWWSIADAQEDALNGRSPTAVVRMTPALPTVSAPWFGSCSKSHAELDALVPGEHYLISALSGDGVRPVKSLKANGRRQRVDFDFQPIAFFSAIHLPGVSLLDREPAAARARAAAPVSRMGIEPVCERCVGAQVGVTPSTINAPGERPATGDTR